MKLAIDRTVSCVVLVLVAACGDLPGTVAPRRAVDAPNRDITYSEAEFTVEGVTYGPNGQLVTPPSCAKTSFLLDSFPVKIKVPGGETHQSWEFIYKYTVLRGGYSPGQCGLNYDPGGALYSGGEVFVAAVSEVDFVSLAAFEAVMNRDVKMLRVPEEASIQLSVHVYDGYRFLYWDVIPQSGAAYHVTDQVLTVPAGVPVAQRYIATFQKGTTNPPPPDDGGGGGCIDPTQPPCGPG